MKKLSMLIIVILFMFGLVGCNNKQQLTDNENKATSGNTILSVDTTQYENLFTKTYVVGDTYNYENVYRLEETHNIEECAQNLNINSKDDYYVIDNTDEYIRAWSVIFHEKINVYTEACDKFFEKTVYLVFIRKASSSNYIKIEYKFNKNNNEIVKIYPYENNIGDEAISDCIDIVEISRTDFNSMNSSSTDEELVNKAKQAYLEQYIKKNRSDATIDDVWLFDNLGVYNHCFIGVFLDKKNCVFPDVVMPQTIENLDFSYSYGHQILVYDGEHFEPLIFAYSKGLILYDDLYKLYKVYYHLDEVEENSNGKITIQLANEIKLAYVKTFRESTEPLTLYEFDNIDIRCYHGCFNGYHIVMMDGYFYYTQAIRKVIIGDVVFNYNDGNSLLAYKDGCFYSLTKAYENNYLSTNDLKEISKLHNNTKLYDIVLLDADVWVQGLNNLRLDNISNEELEYLSKNVSKYPTDMGNINGKKYGRVINSSETAENAIEVAREYFTNNYNSVIEAYVDIETEFFYGIYVKWQYTSGERTADHDEYVISFKKEICDYTPERKSLNSVLNISFNTNNLEIIKYVMDYLYYNVIYNIKGFMLLASNVVGLLDSNVVGTDDEYQYVCYAINTCYGDWNCHDEVSLVKIIMKVDKESGEVVITKTNVKTIYIDGAENSFTIE